MDNESRIKKEKRRLLQYYNGLNESKLALVLPLIEQAAFMRVTLDTLQISINANGVSEDYKNGENQFGKKASAEISAYNSLIKNYTSVVDKLEKMMPASAKGGLARMVEDE